MKGLIKKDLLMMKGSIKISMLLLVVFLVIALKEENSLIFIPAFLTTMLFMATFSYDEYNNWNAYAISLPTGRKNLVRAKYMANLGMLVAVVVIFSLLASIIGVINNNLNGEELIILSCGCIFSLAIFEAILYPFIFRFGIEKGRIGILVGVFGFTGLVSLLKDKIDIQLSRKFLTMLENNWLPLATVIVMILLIISYLISIKIVEKKEF